MNSGFKTQTCEKCGREFPDDLGFCPHCGAPVNFVLTDDFLAEHGIYRPLPGDTRAEDN